jgi:hypothetical protein
MALALGWLEIAGYGGRKGQVQKGFPENKACGGRGGGGGGEGESICHHPTCYNKEIMSNPTSYPKKRKLICSFLPLLVLLHFYLQTPIFSIAQFT